MLDGLKKKLRRQKEEPIESPWPQQVKPEPKREELPLLEVKLKRKGKRRLPGLRRLNRTVVGISCIFNFFFGVSMLLATSGSEAMLLASLFLMSCYGHGYCLWKTRQRPLEWEELGKKEG